MARQGLPFSHRLVRNCAKNLNSTASTVTTWPESSGIAQEQMNCQKTIPDGLRPVPSSLLGGFAVDVSNHVGAVRRFPDPGKAHFCPRQVALGIGDELIQFRLCP